jgi:putative ABC transport system permease protein
MRAVDGVMFALRSLASGGARTMLIAGAMALACFFVTTLAWIAESGRDYVASRFHALGSNLVVVMPGRSSTRGGGMASPLGETARDFTLDDALALLRCDAALRVAPLVVGGAVVSFGARERETTILGTTAEFAPVRRLSMARGVFLQPADPRRGAAHCVLGATVARELFGSRSAVGERVRVQDRTFRVLGELAETGVSLGADLDESVLVPVATAQELFLADGLFRALVEATHRDSIPSLVAAIERTMALRHEGELDVTVMGQDALVASFDGFMRTITIAVAGIASVSLLVAGVLVFDIMTVAVAQRRAEIGLLMALGASAALVRTLFFVEAFGLVACGAAIGTASAFALSFVGSWIEPAMLKEPPTWAVIAALTSAATMGLVFGVRPAALASRLDPCAALARR